MWIPAQTFVILIVNEVQKFHFTASNTEILSNTGLEFYSQGK